MARVGRVEREDGSLYGYTFECPGCGWSHVVPIAPMAGDRGWQFRGNEERPTFTPSILVYEVKQPDGTIFQPRCHSVVADGQIQFQGDCGHPLAGQTHDLPEWKEK